MVPDLWSFQFEKLADGRGQRFALDLDSRPATFANVFLGWQSDPEFRTQFNAILAAAPYSAFRWELPAITASCAQSPFEFVLLDSPSLVRNPDPEAFAEHFAGAESSVVVFENLGGDATMIVPRPVAEASAYGHLAEFVRFAPEHQQQSLWRTVGEEVSKRVGTNPLWLSTAGAGVSWLHVRIDDRPKYFGHGPYRS